MLRRLGAHPYLEPVSIETRAPSSTSDHTVPETLKKKRVLKVQGEGLIWLNVVSIAGTRASFAVVFFSTYAPIFCRLLSLSWLLVDTSTLRWFEVHTYVSSYAVEWC